MYICSEKKNLNFKTICLSMQIVKSEFFLSKTEYIFYSQMCIKVTSPLFWIQETEYTFENSFF